MNEHSITARIRRFLARLRANKQPVWYVKLHGGGPFQRKSLPDLVFVIRGVPIALETKAPNEKPEPTTAQKREMQNMARAGWITHCSNDPDFIEHMIIDALNGKVPYEAGILYSNGREVPW